MMHMIIWRRLDLPGHEWSQLRLTAKGPELAGTAVFAHEDQPCRLSCSIRCDPAWITRSAVIRGSISDIMVDVHLRHSNDGQWTINDTPAPEVIDAQHWRYESNGGSFVRELMVNSEGIVTDYPGLWRREG